MMSRTVDRHHIEEHRFVGMIASAMENVMREHKVPALVVVAPPKTLGDLRDGRMVIFVVP